MYRISLYCIVLREMLVGRRGFFCLTKHCHCIILTTASSEYRLEKNIVEKGSSFKCSAAFNAIFTDSTVSYTVLLTSICDIYSAVTQLLTVFMLN